MVIEAIRLFNLRCYSDVEIRPDARFNVVSGKNGQGKTSLLEAIGLLSFFRSFRGAKNQEVLRIGCSEGKVSGTISREDLRMNLDVRIWPHRKQASFNGKQCRLLSEYVGKLPVVSFSPTDLEIIRGGPETRRTWIDRLGQSIIPEHADLVCAYQRALDQRNRLLKAAVPGNTAKLHAELEPWTEQLASFGSKIVANRLVLCTQMEPWIGEYYARISNQKRSITINYLSTALGAVPGGQKPSPHDSLEPSIGFRECLRRQFEESLQKDILLRATLSGPHRDDLGFAMDGNAAKAFGSQGEIRSLVLAMRLAEADRNREAKGYSPILLIDDFSSELDAHRRGFLLDFLARSDSQVFLTATEEIRLGKAFVVSEGRIFSHDDGFATYRCQQL